MAENETPTGVGGGAMNSKDLLAPNLPRSEPSGKYNVGGTPYATEILRDYMSRPAPVKWDPDFAMALITATAGGFAKLATDAAWLKTLRLTHHPLTTDYEAAALAVDAAYTAHDLRQVALACRRWWKAAQGLQRPAVKAVSA